MLVFNVTSLSLLPLTERSSIGKCFLNAFLTIKEFKTDVQFI